MLNFIKRVLSFLARNGYFDFVPDIPYLKIIYWIRMNKKLNLKNPLTFNEKIQWLKIYYKNPLFPKLADKIEVRNYIASTVGEQYLIPLFHVYHHSSEIDFNTLPSSFVLKPNHTSGDVLLCKNKYSLNEPEIKHLVNKWMSRKYYKVHREWPYKYIIPKILCEELLMDNKSRDLLDYKVLCFNGRAKSIFICSNRSEKLNVDFYDLNWRKLPVKRFYENSPYDHRKPNNLDLMISLAEKLSHPFPLLRVDFYNIEDKLYIGELTLYPGAGVEPFFPEHYDKEFGNWLTLPGIRI